MYSNGMEFLFAMSFDTFGMPKGLVVVIFFLYHDLLCFQAKFIEPFQYKNGHIFHIPSKSPVSATMVVNAFN